MKQLEEQMKLQLAKQKATTKELEVEANKAVRLAAKAARDEARAAQAEEKEQLKLSVLAEKNRLSPAH